MNRFKHIFIISLWLVGGISAMEEPLKKSIYADDISEPYETLAAMIYREKVKEISLLQRIDPKNCPTTKIDFEESRRQLARNTLKEQKDIYRSTERKDRSSHQITIDILESLLKNHIERNKSLESKIKDSNEKQRYSINGGIQEENSRQKEYEVFLTKPTISVDKNTDIPTNNPRKEKNSSDNGYYTKGIAYDSEIPANAFQRNKKRFEDILNMAKSHKLTGDVVVVDEKELARKQRVCDEFLMTMGKKDVIKEEDLYTLLYRNSKKSENYLKKSLILLANQKNLEYIYMNIDWSLINEGDPVHVNHMYTHIQSILDDEKQDYTHIIEFFNVMLMNLPKNNI